MSNNVAVIENQSVISNLSHDGRGVISNNGKKVLIDGVLPGEEVSWTYTKRHKRYDEAKVVTVLKAVDYRVPAICPNFLVCGGCSYQHIATNKQLEHKQAIVAELLEHIGKVTPKAWLPPLQAATSGYRTKARLGIRYVIKKQKLLIGFREKSSNYITDMDTCKVLHPALDKLFEPLSKLIAALSNYDQIPQIELAMGDEAAEQQLPHLGSNIAIILRHLTGFSETDKILLFKFAEDNNINLLLQPGDQDSVHVLYGTDQLFYSVQIQNKHGNPFTMQYHFHPQDFTQVNLAINKLMLQQTINLLNLSGDEKILDLFCGLGNFTLPIAKILEQQNGHVLGIEGCQKMVQRAEQNAQLNNINNVKFESVDLYNEEKLASNNGFISTNYDWVVLDPPRSGASQVLPYIASNNINKILYVSCDPATFARDVGILCHEYGYKLHKVGIMDMFPHTKHVETMGLLKK
jgi:23S rRNA (uracil1939-C5)-methyltransferase